MEQNVQVAFSALESMEFRLRYPRRKAGTANVQSAKCGRCPTHALQACSLLQKRSSGLAAKHAVALNFGHLG